MVGPIVAVLLAAGASTARAQTPPPAADVAAIMQADADFAKAVADRESAPGAFDLSE